MQVSDREATELSKYLESTFSREKDGLFEDFIHFFPSHVGT